MKGTEQNTSMKNYLKHVVERNPVKSLLRAASEANDESIDNNRSFLYHYDLDMILNLAVIYLYP